MNKMCSRCGLYKQRSAFNQCLEHADKLSHWCMACDKRNAKHGYGNTAVPWPPTILLPGRETACPACHCEWRFDTDREGCLVQICKCGMAYVAIKDAPKVLRKPTGPRILAHASGQRQAKTRDVRRWAFHVGDTG